MDQLVCSELARVWFMQVKLTKISFIMTLSKVRFIQVLVNVELGFDRFDYKLFTSKCISNFLIREPYTHYQGQAGPNIYDQRHCSLLLNYLCGDLWSIH